MSYTHQTCTHITHTTRVHTCHAHTHHVHAYIPCTHIHHYLNALLPTPRAHVFRLGVGLKCWGQLLVAGVNNTSLKAFWIISSLSSRLLVSPDYLMVTIFNLVPWQGMCQVCYFLVHMQLLCECCF